MNDVTPQNSKNETPPADNREPWQKLDFEKIAASDAEGAVGSGTFDGTTYS